MDFDFTKYKCIGILGGSFNPVHNGHIMMAKVAYEQLEELEKVVFLPNNLPAYKDANVVVSKDNRVAMLELAIKDMDYAAISYLEFKRGGFTYTLDTLLELKVINPELKIYYIIGADSLFTLDKWYCYQDVLKLCSFLVVSRECDEESMKAAIKKLKKTCPKCDIQILKNEEYKVSSSNIRECVARNESVEQDVPEGVFDYIKTNHLYGWK